MLDAITFVVDEKEWTGWHTHMDVFQVATKTKENYYKIYTLVARLTYQNNILNEKRQINAKR